MKTWRKLRDNPGLWPRYFIREKTLQAIRTFFAKEGFHEVETPLLISAPPAESYLDVFETTLYDRARRPQKAYLSTSPEVALKKLLVSGIGNCFALTHSFRNMETQSKLHNPEFTILEWYRVGADYTAIMEDCEKLMWAIHRAINQGKNLVYQGETIDLAPPWERLTVASAFAKWAHINFNDFLQLATARKVAQAKGYQVTENNTWEELYNQIFLNEIEPHLGRGRPTIIYEFPAAMAALSQKKKTDPRFAERFEFYIGGLELGDCYSELTNWREQQKRFEKELEEIKRLGKTVYDYDHDFIEALKAGLPKTSGIAVGVDRLIMLFADTKDIADTLFFPASEEFTLPTT